MELSPGLHTVGSIDVEATACAARKLGYKVFVLPAKGIVDKRTFFHAVYDQFPLDPEPPGPPRPSSSQGWGLSAQSEGAFGLG